MKIITFYLPQFHEVEENNEWWGEGFTEWTNVKRSSAILKSQNFPRVPMDKYYYNLLDKQTVMWQTKLSKDYGIYGFCYFHYWFNGRKILEKPAENLLKWKDITQKFCFAWANVSWARTWKSEFTPATTWVSNDKEGGSELLIEQEYGVEEDWKLHFDYLLNFFKDDRYIKVDNKPMLLIYQVTLIDCSDAMFELWNDLAKKEGFNGIHIVAMNKNIINNKYIEAIAHYEPVNTRNQLPRWHSLKKLVRNKILKPLNSKNMVDDIMEYNKLWEEILKRKPNELIKTYPGAFVGYDDTPRKGNRAVVVKNDTPELFYYYLKKQIKRTKTLFETDILFINAWNEWAESNYLEPDEEHGYGYLEAVKRALDEVGNE